MKNSGDVYMANREGGKWIKSSFHESGRWHYGVTERGQELGDSDGDAYIAVTHEHQEVVPGWARGKRITVAVSELRTWAEPDVVSAMVAIDVPPDCDAVSVDLLLSGQDSPPLLVSAPARLVASLRRGDGGLAILIRSPHILDAPIHATFELKIAEVRDGIRIAGWDGNPTRVVLFGHDDDLGSQRDVEVAVDS